MHKKTERDIRTKTPTVHSNNPRTLNEFAKQLFLVTHEDKPHKYSSTIFRLFFSFFYLNFFEPRANNQSSNFRKSVERNRRQDTSSLTINSVHSIHSLDGILEEISLILESARRSSGSMDRMNWIEIDAIFARTDRGTKRDWCRLSGTRLISSLSSPRMLIFLPLLPPRFSSFFVRSLYTDTSISCERETSI